MAIFYIAFIHCDRLLHGEHLCRLLSIVTFQQEGEQEYKECERAGQESGHIPIQQMLIECRHCILGLKLMRSRLISWADLGSGISSQSSTKPKRQESVQQLKAPVKAPELLRPSCLNATAANGGSVIDIGLAVGLPLCVAHRCRLGSVGGFVVRQNPAPGLGSVPAQQPGVSAATRKCIEFALKAKPVRRYIPQRRLQYKIWWFVTSTPFEYGIFVLIMPEHHRACHEGQPESYSSALDYMNMLFTAIFTIEFLLKLLAFSFRNYFSDLWNIHFDFVIVLGSYIDIISGKTSEPGPTQHGTGRHAGKATISINFFRLFRAMRLVKAAEQGRASQDSAVDFYQIVSGPALRRPAHPHAVLHLRLSRRDRMQMFGKIRLDSNTHINRNNNFRTFFSASLVLFRSATGEAWQEILLACRQR
uniref:Ion_trans domain-containing protein n=1 Tax=Macrostomum lignano TaxID=282301 RepID=A0A1I8FJI4_9PLAT